MTFVMNQPLYEVEPNVFTRGIPINPSRLNRVQTDLSGAAHETPCHKALGGAYAISPDDDDELFERTELRTSRRASTKELGVYGDAQAICEGNLRSRPHFGALYQAAVDAPRGVDMLEVRDEIRDEVRCGKFAVSGWRCADAAAGAEREWDEIRCGKFAVSGWRCADAAAGAEREVRCAANLQWDEIRFDLTTSRGTMIAYTILDYKF
ncbi:hypothetical protein CYMTET_9796 [Cymbomonas tetramitiformis]|uniref:Uncharacterized protein n=1 Tax=Cymbomonas tetramitiformis TaxID=36881 RepID=A0AAE0GS13_9CHLO|nr:hypothetical protein CYMTET_9796 [Cymbomonas tetramitiformis]